MTEAQRALRWRDTLQFRLVLSSFALALSLLVLIGVGVYRKFANDRGAAVEQLQANRLHAQRLLGTYLERLQFQLTGLEQLADFSQLDSPHAHAVCAQFLRLHSEFINIAVIDRAGTLRFSTLFPVSDPPQNYRSMPNVQEVLTTRDYRISSAARGLTTGRWGCVAAKPVIGRPDLILTASIDLRILSQQLLFAPDDPTLVVSVADRHNTIVLSSLNPTTLIGQQRPAAQAVARALAGGQAVGEYVGADGVRRTYDAGALPAADWLVTADMPTAEVYRGAWRNLWQSLAFVAVGLVVCLLLIRHFTRSIAQPILALADAARDQAAGLRDATAPEIGPAEVVETARAFNRMVAARQRSETSLQESEQRYRTVVDQTGQMIYDLDLASDRMAWFGARAVELTTGYPLAEFPAGDRKGYTELIHPDDREIALGRFARCQTAGQPFHMEYRLRQKDGTFRYVEDHGVFLPGPHGRPYRMLGRVSDITERKRAAETLRQIIDLVPHFIFAKDLHGRFILANEPVAAALGTSSEELIGRTAAEFLPADPEASTALEDDREVIRTGQPKTIPEETFTDVTGRVRILSTIKIPFHPGEAEKPAVLGVSVDITELKKSASDRQRIEKKLRETQKLESLGVLAGGIAHDFNNLLTGVLGNAGLARHDAPPGWSGVDLLGHIEKAALQAAELCQQMLAYSGKGRFVIQRIDLNELIRDTTQLLTFSISKKAGLCYNLAPSVPPIEADATQIRQVVMNLLINASEAFGEHNGIITLSTGSVSMDAAYLAQTQLASELAAGDYVYLEVADNGCGMSPETLALIFDPFFTTKFAGRGLGLAAVHGIVRGHHGAIQVASEPGHGTVFKVFIPVTTGEAEAVVASTPAAPDWRGSGRLLIVDDEQAVRLVTARIAETLGFTVETAADGAEGLALFQAKPEAYAAVLLDLTMPRLDGEETFRQMRQQCPAVRVILMSGFNKVEAVNRFVGQGLAGFLQKPFEMGALPAERRRVLDGTRPPI